MMYNKEKKMMIDNNVNIENEVAMDFIMKYGKKYREFINSEFSDNKEVYNFFSYKYQRHIIELCVIDILKKKKGE